MKNEKNDFLDKSFCWGEMGWHETSTLRIESFLKRKIILNIIFFFDVAKSFVEQKLSL